MLGCRRRETADDDVVSSRVPLLHDDSVFARHRSLPFPDHVEAVTAARNAWHTTDISEPVVELQVETMSSVSTRVFLYSWYIMLLIALLIQSSVPLQWQMRNVCGSTVVSLTDLQTWNSTSCVQWQVHWVPVKWRDRVISLVRAAPAGWQSATLRYLPGGNTTSRSQLPYALWDAAAFAALADAGKNDEDVVSSSREMDAPYLRPTIAPYKKVYHLRWLGSNLAAVINLKLSRYVRVVVSLGSPMERIQPVHLPKMTYRMVVALEEEVFIPSHDDFRYSSSGSDFSSSSSSSVVPPLPPDPRYYTYNATVTCYRDRPRCSTLVLPPSVAIASNESKFTLTLLGVNSDLAQAALSDVAVGFTFQRPGYTLGTMLWRYASMVYSLLSVGRFLSRAHHRSLVAEQYWVLLLQGALLLYLNPFFALGVYHGQHPQPVWQFLELHVPNYFAALVVCFTFAIIAASYASGSRRRHGPHRDPQSPEGASQSSLRCRQRVGSSGGGSRGYLPPRNQSASTQDIAPTCVDGYTGPAATTTGLPRPIMDASAWRRLRHMPPAWVNVGLFLYFLTVVGLDVAQTSLEDWEWGAEATCHTTSCQWVARAMAVLLLVGIATNGIALLGLQRTLATRSYLESRPQQLAYRILFFIFFTAVLYLAGQVVLVTILYPQILDIVYYQPLLQLSPIMVCTFFINHMTYVYTSTSASNQVPFRPDNPQWRCVSWSRQWFRWLEWHGGSRYIFFNESQERLFEAIQRVRLTTDATRRGHAPSTRASSLVDSEEGYEESDAVDSERDRAHAAGTNDHRQRRRSLLAQAPRRVLHTLLDVPSALTGGAAAFLDFVEDTLTERPLHVLLRSKPRQRLPGTRHGFFNLETAMDCFNLSWEAYADLEAVGRSLATTVILGGVNDMDADTVMEGRAWWERLAEGVLLWLMHGRHGGQPSESPFPQRLSTAATTEAGAGSTSGRLTSPLQQAAPRASEVCDTPSHRPLLPTTETPPSSPHPAVTPAPVGQQEGSPSDRSTFAASPSAVSPTPLTGIMDPERFGYSRVAVIIGRSVQVLVTRMDRAHPQHRDKEPRLVVAFRGTNNVCNAMQDIRVRQRTWKEMESGSLLQPRARVHSGFLETWMSLKEQVLKVILYELQRGGGSMSDPTATAEPREEVWPAPRYPTSFPSYCWSTESVYVTGHSLGGALACLCAYSLRRALLLMEYLQPEVTVYTFGQPGIGNRAFQRIYNRAVPLTFRVVNENDAVSGLSFLGNDHVGTEVDIDRHGNYVCRPMYVESMFRPTRGRGLAVYHHTMTAYAQSLNAIAQRHAGPLCPVRCLVPYTDGYLRGDEIESFETFTANGMGRAVAAEATQAGPQQGAATPRGDR